MFKRIVSLFLAAAFLAVPVYAGADDGYELEDGYVYEMPGTENFLAYRPAETYAAEFRISEDEYAELADRIFSAAKNFEDSCNILDFSIPISGTPGNLLNYMIKKGDPETFHIKSFSYSVQAIGGTYCFNNIYFNYYYTKDEYDAMISVIRRAAHSLLLGIEGNDALSDVQKALLIHDRLIVHCEYDAENYYGTGVIPIEDYTIYGALVNRVCVCEGFSEAYCYLLDQVGIKNYLCESFELAHMWNIVYIDGEKYHVDLTFDDPIYDITGNVYHDYFLCSTNRMTAYDHNASDYDQTPVSTTYDNAFWHDSVSQFVLCGGEIYFINCSSGMLCKLADNGPVTVKDLGGKWFVSQNAYFPKKFTRLASDGRYLYYSLPKEVRKYDPETGADTLIYKYEPDSTKPYFSIYGMAENDGVLTLDVYNTANFDMDTKATYGFSVKYREPEPELYDYNWGEWEYTEPPTCTEGGTAKRVCLYNPDHVEYKEVEPLGHRFSATEMYCLNGCGAENPDFVPAGFSVICDGEIFDKFEADAEVTLPTPGLKLDKFGAAYRFFTWSGYNVVRGRYSPNNNTANGRIYTMTMPESDVDLTAVYSLVGDVNDDGRINSKDLSALKKVLAGSYELDDAGIDRADLDCNDRNNSKDVSAMKKLLGGNYTIPR